MRLTIATAASRGLPQASATEFQTQAQGCLRIALFQVDQVCNLEIEGQIWLEVLRIACAFYVTLCVSIGVCQVDKSPALTDIPL